MGEMIWRASAFGGVDTSVDEALLPVHSSPDAQNMDTQGGNLAVSKGYVKFSGYKVPGGVKTLCGFFLRDGQGFENILLAAGPQGLFCLRAGGWERIASLQSWDVNALQYQDGEDDILLIANGDDTVLRWDGKSAVTQLTGCPQKFAHLALHYERVWGAGAKGEPDTAYWSRSFNPTDWTNDPVIPEAGGGFIMLPTFNGGKILGMKTIFNDIVVFKQQDILRILGTYPGDYVVVRVHGVVGPIAENTIVCGGDVCYYLSREGLCFYDGVRAKPMGDLRVEHVLSRMNAAYASCACAVIYSNKLLVALPEGESTHNNVVLEYDLLRKVWMVRRGLRVDCFLEWDGRLLFANDTGFVYEYGVGESYDGAPIDAYWTVPMTDLGHKDKRKSLQAFRAVGSGQGRLVLTVKTDRREKKRRLPLGREKLLRAGLILGGRRFGIRLDNEQGKAFVLRGGVEMVFEVEG